MRLIKVDDNKLAKILEERGVIYKQIAEINEQLSKLDKERTKLGYKMDKLKEKTTPVIEKLTPTFELGEFEIISRVYLNQEQYPEVEIVDVVELYKEDFRKKNK